MPKITPTFTNFGLIGQTYIDPNEGTERTFRDVNELLATLEKNNAMNSPMGNELRVLQQASKDSGIPLQTLYEYRQATSGPMASRNAHLFNPETAGALESAMSGLGSLRPSGGGGLFNIASRAAGSALGSASRNVIGPIGDAVKENPWLLYAAPLATAAISGALSGAGAGSAFGGGAATSATAPASAAAAPAAASAAPTLAPGAGVIPASSLPSGTIAAGAGVPAGFTLGPAGAAIPAGGTSLAQAGIAAGAAAGPSINIGNTTAAAATPAATSGAFGGANGFLGLTAAELGMAAGGTLLNFLGSNRAADQLAGSAQAGIDALTQADQRTRQDLAPFVQGGANIMDPLFQFVSQGPETELERVEGFRNIENSQAARGKLRSGDTLKELTAFNNMLNQRNRSQRFSELFNLATLGANAAGRQGTNTLGTASGIANLLTGAGSAQAAGTLGGANVLNDFLANFNFLRQANAS